MDDIVKRHVLVVDDDADNLELAVLLMSSDGYSVAGASDCDSALRMLTRSTPDLIVLDCFLESEFAMLLSELKSRNLMQKVLLCSGVSTLSERRLRWGAGGALQKPFELEEFLNLAGKLSDRRRQNFPFTGTDRRGQAC